MRVTQKQWIRFRIYLVAGFLLLGLAAVSVRVVQLQILEGRKLADTARRGYISAVSLPPKRGGIFDRQGNALAVSVEVGSVYAHPALIRDRVKTARLLADTLEEPRRTILGHLKKRTSFVWIKRGIPTAMAEAVRDLGLEGVGVTSESRRFYPGREIAGHLLGFVGTDNQGLEGLEKRYDHLLSGPGIRLVRMRDALGRPFSVSRPVAQDRSRHGLVLTIDKHIQYRAQEALEKAVTRAKARGGHVLVVDPRSGEILAMAVVPSFNPNAFRRYRPDQWRNRIITDTFEPGSTMKAFLLAASLQQGVITPLTVFDCEEGAFRVGKHIINDTHEYGILNAADVVIHSSNIGAVKMGQRLGYERYRDYLLRFGFGRKTGIGLLGERSGFIRPAGEARAIDQATVFFGQGLTVTSLQLVMAMAAIANGGRLMRPYVVQAVVDESGRKTRRGSPHVVRQVISEKHAATVTHILEGVTGPGGTAPRAAIKGFQVAGKTGTAQKVDPKTKLYSRRKFIAAFVGFVPAARPRLVILALIDEPQGAFYGGQVAAPVFREVAEWALHYLRVAPDIPLAEKMMAEDGPPARPAGPSRRLSSGDMVPDFTGLGMRQVLRSGQDLGLEVVLQGTGFAVRQDPRAGTSLQNAGRLKVWFHPPG